MLGEMKKKNLKSGDFVFWRAARQGAAGAQRASYGAGGNWGFKGTLILTFSRSTEGVTSRKRR